jgi:hypothetical protein
MRNTRRARQVRSRILGCTSAFASHSGVMGGGAEHKEQGRNRGIPVLRDLPGSRRNLRQIWDVRRDKQITPVRRRRRMFVAIRQPGRVEACVYRATCSQLKLYVAPANAGATRQRVGLRFDTTRVGSWVSSGLHHR